MSGFDPVIRSKQGLIKARCRLFPGNAYLDGEKLYPYIRV
jgi:hypothetical protein